MSTPRRPGASEATVPDPTPGARAPIRGGFLLVAGQGRLWSVPVSDEITIGRGEDCALVLADKSLSRRHAVLRGGPPITIQDLGSTNGTRIGTVTLKGGDPFLLGAGDSFTIGPFTLVVVGRGVGDAAVSWRDLLKVVDPTPDGVPEIVREIAATDSNVVILGETGVGKEVLAETIHRLSRRRGELVRINCAALSESLLESELFGHEKGAFTGAAGVKAGLLEAANGGTVFLDEVGELPAGLQAKLLRAVEQREVLRLGSTRPVPLDVRFLAATNRDLPADVDAGKFRRDLFFRLDGVTLAISPLRERRGMIGTLAMKFLDDACRKAGRAGVKLRADTLAALGAYAWPGNVRELKAVCERALLLGRGGDPEVHHLVFAASTPAAAAAAAVVSDAPEGLSASERDERASIIRILEEHAGNQTRAAKQLGISRTTLVNKIKLYRIARPRS